MPAMIESVMALVSVLAQALATPPATVRWFSQRSTQLRDARWPCPLIADLHYL